MPSTEVASPRARKVVLAIALTVVLAMLWPSLRRPPQDSYPLSTYPMFSRERSRTSVVATVVGRTADGEVRRLSPALIGGTDEVMLAVATVSRAARAGSARQAELCSEVAARVSRSARRRAPDPVTQVEVRRETYDSVAWFAERRREPAAVEVLAACEVDPGG